jgi:tetratricopeptide (TPR) repeat protein
VTPRRRILLLVAAVCFAAVAAVAVVALASDGGSTPESATTRSGPREGRPPLSFALGFRRDAEARDLARAAALYASGDTRGAAALFAKYDSLEAKVGAAFASWPSGTLDRLEQLAKLYPDVPVVRLHLGLARLWANSGDPTESWQAVVEAAPDTPYAIVAGNLLHPSAPRGLPAFIPSFTASPEVTRLPPERQLDALRRRAGTGGLRDLLLYGVGLQRVGRSVSAARVFERAAKRYPGNVEALVAAAVGQYDKDEPERAFGVLGPLTRAYGDEPTVRFHLGVLLLWTGRVQEAERQLRLAAKTKPGSPLAQEAARYLETIQKARS